MGAFYRFKRKLAKNYVNFRGTSLNKKYVVIESDDWGAIRTCDRQSYERMLKAGIQVDKDYFDRYDSLESEKDLTELFEVLSSIKDHTGNTAVITPLSIMANPAFECIEENGKEKYVFETVLETYKRQEWTHNSFDIIKEGIRGRVFYPQFHAREHYHVKRWMNAIVNPTKKEQLAFENRSIVISRMASDPKRINLDYFPTFDLDDLSEIQQLKDNMLDGTRLFEQIYGYKSISFCPPCGIIRDELLEAAVDFGILGLQAGQHFIPQGDGCSLKKVDHFWGEKTSANQIYWRRNCSFEPAKNHDMDWVDSCMSEIAIAFRWGKPAVINSHRVNYIGVLDPKNREDSLRQLNKLLHQIVKTWPDVEFINSQKLYYILCRL